MKFTPVRPCAIMKISISFDLILNLENWIILELPKKPVMGNLLSFYCQFFATQIIGGAKELVAFL